MNQRKKLANGKEIKIFSRQPRGNSGNFIYSCHLCGFIDLGNEQALQMHIVDQMHRDLLKLPTLPFRSWMKEVVIEEQKSKPCALGCGDCSDLKTMLERMCGMTKTAKIDQHSTAKNVIKVESRTGNLKRMTASDANGSSKEKRRRHRSPEQRKSRSRNRKSAK